MHHVVSGFKDDDSSASSCSQISRSLIFQIREHFCFTDQIFWHKRVPAWDPDPTAWKKHLTCQSEGNISQQLEMNKSQHPDFNRRLNGMFTASTFLMHSSLHFVNHLFLNTRMFSIWMTNLPVGSWSWSNAVFLSYLVWLWHKASSTILQNAAESWTGGLSTT